MRFPRFSTEWEEKNIGSVLSIGSGKDYKHLNEGEVPVYGTGGYMTSVDKYLYDGESIGIGRKGTIDKPILLKGKFWTVDTLFYTHSFINSEPKFLFSIFQKINWKKYNEASGVPSLSKTTIEKIRIRIPSQPEQKKLTSFISLINERIDTQSKIIEHQESLMKGGMQKIFSQQLRFKDENGSRFPDWEFKKAKEIFKNHSNKKHNGELSILSASQEKGMIYRDGSGIKIQSSEKSVKSYKIVEPGDFVISLRSFQGGLDYSNIMGICSPAYTVLKNTMPIFNEFYKYYFKKERFINRLNQTTIGIRDGKQITYDNFGALLIPYPSVPEQTKIANFLSSLDEKLEKEKEILEQYQQQKKYLLQNLFV